MGIEASLKPRENAPFGRVVGRVDPVIGLALLAGAVIIGVVGDGMPGSARLGRNAEALAFVGLYLIDRSTVPPHIQSRLWQLWAAVLAAVALLLETSEELGAGIVTLNEAVIAALILSICTRLGRAAAIAALGGVLLIAVVGEILDDAGTGWIVRQAETWGFVALTVGYLFWKRAGNERNPIWFLTMIAMPVLIMLFNDHGVDSASAAGLVESTLVWLQRNFEAFLAAAMIAGLDLVYERRAKREPASVLTSA